QIRLTGLHDDTTYYFLVRSSDSSNNKATSDEYSLKTKSSFVDQPPTAPGPITAPALTKDTSVMISWGASTDDVGIAGYDLIQNGQVVMTLPGSSTSATVNGLSEGIYAYRVRATDSAQHSVL